jgi:hypothetical protein
MFLVLTFEPRDYVINSCYLKHLDVCELKYSMFILASVLFCLPIFLGEPWLESFVRVSRLQAKWRGGRAVSC